MQPPSALRRLELVLVSAEPREGEPREGQPRRGELGAREPLVLEQSQGDAAGESGDEALELEVARDALRLGVARFHLRKPGWPAARMERWLLQLDPSLRARVLVHSHHDQAERWGTGVHLPDRPAATLAMAAGHRFRSRSCHDISTLRAALGRYDAVFVSPLFPSISKPGYGPAGPTFHAELASLLARRAPAERRTKVVGLGGIELGRIARCRELGLDGVAALGAVWRAPRPPDALRALLAACAGACGGNASGGRASSGALVP